MQHSTVPLVLAHELYFISLQMRSLTLNKHHLFEGAQSEGLIKRTEGNIWIREEEKKLDKKGFGIYIPQNNYFRLESFPLGQGAALFGVRFQTFFYPS